jgi:LDH2 family malate/lactate/ureidoglycolate dehydrogenase
MAEKRRREGIELDETTWQQIREAAELVGIDPEKWH